MQTIVVQGSVLILGCGAVSRCFLQLFIRHVTMDYSKLIIVDKADTSESVLAILERGAQFVRKDITTENIEFFLGQHLKAGDILIDLATGIPTIDLLEWCQRNDVLFLNTSLEWPTKIYDKESFNPENTLYWQHGVLKRKATHWKEHGATAVIEHGANPGLVSHWTKVALVAICTELLKKNTSSPALERALSENNFAELAYLSGTKVIHISERDTQITVQPKKVNQFVNSWSTVGLYEEALLPAEFGCGTHEPILDSMVTFTEGPQNQAYLKKFGMNTLAYSWVPDGPIIGMLISHAEAYTISEHLTLLQDGKLVYRPSVYFVYLVSDPALASLHELRMRDWRLQDDQRIMSDDIIDGTDQMGVLLLGHDINGWWTGSTLSIHETRKLVGPGHNPTTLQVAASMIGALAWMVKNPRKGLCMPDDLPYAEILSIATPYLGIYSSMQTDWRPKHQRDTISWALSDFLVSC